MLIRPPLCGAPQQEDLPERKHATSRRRAPALDGAPELRRLRAEMRDAMVREVIADWVSEIGDGETVLAISTGGVDMPMVLVELARLCAPAVLRLATWGISDPGVRMIHRALEDGLISQVRCAVDSHVWTKRGEAWAYLREISSATAEVCAHAKVYTVVGATRGFGVVGSANLTRNPMCETLVVTAQGDVVRWLSEWIDAEIAGAQATDAG